jgi:hypothetical protein
VKKDIHPVEAMRRIAQEIADEAGLKVDHASFDRAKSYTDEVQPASTLTDLKLALIQARVVNLGLLVHTAYECGKWMAWDHRSYDGPRSPLGIALDETTAIVELLEQVENRQ